MTAAASQLRLCAAVTCCARCCRSTTAFTSSRCGTRSHLYPQVRETLQALRAQGVKLAVVTNKEGRYTAVVLDAHQLASDV